MKDQKNKIDNLLSNLQDDILDEYNASNISHEEMVKIMKWCNKVIADLKKGNSNGV